MIIQIKFKGLDDWFRPVFKVQDKKVYLGDCEKLWTFDELGEDNEIINQYYRENPDALVIFGSKFNCEPMGTNLKKEVKIEIIE